MILSDYEDASESYKFSVTAISSDSRKRKRYTLDFKQEVLDFCLNKIIKVKPVGKRPDPHGDAHGAGQV
ncbi:hypothetical protein BpHYR1_014927 [Brachionus plicatilis]|uniref:Uncharacterized protein n=1 Tax=Brachionus plicatilis TaxID=10195 RepID=A0A3M7RFD8_BRAPC|nr:hypothetical protein BpHYR1_014927 [Brachionus plicatilis]